MATPNLRAITSANVATEAGPLFYLVGNDAKAPGGAPVLTDDDTIEFSKGSKTNYNGWASNYFRTDESMADAVEALGLTEYELLHQAKTEKHLLFPILDFVPITVALLNEGNIKGFKAGRGESIGLPKGWLPGVVYAWYDEKDDTGNTRRTSRVEFMAAPMVFLRGTEDKQLEAPFSKQMTIDGQLVEVALTAKVTQSGLRTQDLLAELAKGATILDLLWEHRDKIVPFWVECGADKDFSQEMYNWVFTQDNYKDGPVPPWMIHLQLTTSKQQRKLGSSATSNQYTHRLLTPTGKDLTLESALNSLLFPHEIQLVAPMVEHFQQWSMDRTVSLESATASGREDKL